MSGRKLTVSWNVPWNLPNNLTKGLVNCTELLTLGCLMTRRQNRFVMMPLRQINALHCAFAGRYLSLVCNKTTLFFPDNNKFYLLTDKIQEYSTFGSALNSVISNSQFHTSAICLWWSKMSKIALNRVTILGVMIYINGFGLQVTTN